MRIVLLASVEPRSRTWRISSLSGNFRMTKSLLATSCAAALFLAAGPVLAQTVAGGSGNIETVGVTGPRDQAQNVKRQAQTILDIAPLDQIRSMPDSNAAEALQRLPGI